MIFPTPKLLEIFRTYGILKVPHTWNILIRSNVMELFQSKETMISLGGTPSGILGDPCDSNHFDYYH